MTRVCVYTVTNKMLCTVRKFPVKIQYQQAWSVTVCCQKWQEFRRTDEACNRRGCTEAWVRGSTNLWEKTQSLLLTELLIKVFLSGSFKIWLERLYVLCYSKEGNVREKSSQTSCGGLKKQMSGFGNPI